jgi:glycosyltransferase involved in cell wall biosynthesis
MTWNWEKGNEERERNGVEERLPRPTPFDIQYMACAEAVMVALRHMPDWVIVTSGMYFLPDAYIMMQRAGFAVATIFTESPYDDDQQMKVLPYTDVAFVNDRWSAEQFSDVHRQAHYLPHSYDPGKHYPNDYPSVQAQVFAAHAPLDEQTEVPAHDVVFVGTGFRERLELLAAVDWTGIDLGLYGSYDLLEDMPEVAAKLKPYLHDEIIDNDVTASLYRNAKIGLNMHRRSRGFGMEASLITAAHSTNPSLFELAACGVFTISDYRPEVQEIFGDLVPTFTTPDDLESQIRRWLGDEAGRVAVSSQLPRAVERHTFADRAEFVSDILTAQLEQTWQSITARRASFTSQRLARVLPAQLLR